MSRPKQKPTPIDIIKATARRTKTIKTPNGDLVLHSPTPADSDSIRLYIMGDGEGAPSTEVLARAFVACAPEGVDIDLAKEFINATGGEAGDTAQVVSDLCGLGRILQSALSKTGLANRPT